MKEIELKEATKIYKAIHGPKIVALEKISLTIERGEFVFVTGRSGSGKSTLLKLINGQMLPTEGEVWVRGHCTTKMKPSHVPFYRRQFGTMQMDMRLLKDRTVQENIKLAMYATEQPEKVMEKRVRRVLRTVGILERLDHYPEQLSGGEEARALLARALVTEPKILVLDEPTANLDTSNAWDLMNLIDRINQKGLTVVVASHNRELVSIMKKRVVTLAAGAKVSDEKKKIYDIRAGDIFAEREVLRKRAVTKPGRKNKMGR